MATATKTKKPKPTPLPTTFTDVLNGDALRVTDGMAAALHVLATGFREDKAIRADQINKAATNRLLRHGLMRFSEPNKNYALLTEKGKEVCNKVGI